MRDKRKKNRKQQRVMQAPETASQIYREEPATNPRLKALILEVVENQIREHDPPETGQTFERLLEAGYPRGQAVEMIGSAVVEEIWGMLHEQKPYSTSVFHFFAQLASVSTRKKEAMHTSVRCLLDHKRSR